MEESQDDVGMKGCKIRVEDALMEKYINGPVSAGDRKIRGNERSRDSE